jgi:diguanylate cyclase (GGDEF)-like protein
VLVLGFLTSFSVLTQRDVAARSRTADAATKLAAAYADARFWVGQEESLERKYRLEPSPGVRRLHESAERTVERDLARVREIDGSTVTRHFIDDVISAHAGYVRASDSLFAAVDTHNPSLVNHVDHAIADPAFHEVQTTVDGASGRASRLALAESGSLRRGERNATRWSMIAFALGVLLIAAFAGILFRLRRRLAGARQLELDTLADLVMRDPLTGVGNHRAFHEALPRTLHEIGQNAGPASVALILLDLDGLKVVNDTLGHQAGDEYITLVAAALVATAPETSCVYRVGGDEFAVLLENQSGAGASRIVNRVEARLAAVDRPIRLSISGGIAEATEYRHKDALIREADLALRCAKRGNDSTVVYVPLLEEAGQATPTRLHTGTLANALALAVDAKDAYTRSHCQTVSQLCALVAGELGLSPGRVSRMRLAGLLHDVGKIGVPDAILNKPGPLTDDEYLQMQRHATLGGEIVGAADLAEESDWVRHHHERFDGTGYPDSLAGSEIPLESRIILVCDAYEAMTSNRPYRAAPGHAHAIQELRRNARTQFDPRVVDALCRALSERAVAAEPGQRDLAEVA